MAAIYCFTWSESSEEDNIELEQNGCHGDKINGGRVDLFVDFWRLVGKVNVVSVHCMFQNHVHPSCEKETIHKCTGNWNLKSSFVTKLSS